MAVDPGFEPMFKYEGFPETTSPKGLYFSYHVAADFQTALIYLLWMTGVMF